MHVMLFLFFLIFSLSPMEAKTHAKKKRHATTKTHAKKKRTTATKAAKRRKKAVKATVRIKPARNKSQAVVAKQPAVISGKIPLPTQTQYKPIIDQTDEYTYTVKRISGKKVVIFLEFPSFTFVPEVAAAVESDIQDPISPILGDLKHPTITIDAPYKAVNKVKITLESDYIVDVSLPLIGSFKAHDLCIHFIAEQKQQAKQ